MRSLACPLRGLASRFSPKIQAVLNSGKARSGLFLNKIKKSLS
jgi:hypothetical protein